MKQQLFNIIQKYSQYDYVEIHYEINHHQSISYQGQNLDNAGSSQSTSGNVRIYHKGFWSFASFNNPNIEKYAQKAHQNIQFQPQNIQKKYGLTPSQTLNHHFKTTYSIHPQDVPLLDKVALMQKYNQIILQNPQIQTSQSVYRHSVKQSFFANSEKSFLHSEKIFTGIALVAVARDGLNIQRGYFTDARYSGFEIAQNREENCHQISKIARDLLNAKPFKKGKYHVLLDQKMAGVFAHEAFGHLSESDFIYQNPSLQKIMQIGRPFAPPFLNITDDATLQNLAGSLPFDDEGIPGQKKILIKDGKLNSRLNSRETSFILNEKPSGNARHLNPLFPPIVRMTNTFIENGNYSFDQLISMMENGVYCKDYLGGMTNLEMFTFTAAQAFQVKNGKITQPLRDVVLTGNVFETLNHVQALGNDLKHFGGLGGCGKNGQNGLPVTIGGPHIYIKDVLIAGQ